MAADTVLPLPEDPPGAPRDPETARALAEAHAALGPGHTPRTHRVDGEGRARFTNRLIREASPYLLQHAHNPVDWHAWNAETLAKAEAEGRPIFLSVGYATCHWCHVMEEESFDDEEVAALINAHFVPVKIDREERPDLDAIYIAATQLQQGHAGWPNSVFLRPDGRPFHTGTYFPKPQFMQLLEAVAGAWADPGKRPEIDRVADALSEAIARQSRARLGASAAPGPQTFATAVAALADIANDAEGGFSEGQQFPQEVFLLFLLDHWRRTGEAPALRLATATLDAIAKGGIHDHAGGGFHRYTVDPNWRTPHFEKMLYNQALLARAFLEGYEATGRTAYARAASRAFGYVRRDMTDESGAFFSAEDADSLSEDGRREEGAFYVWTPESFAAALGEEAPVLAPLLGMAAPPTLDGSHVLHIPKDVPLDPHALDDALDRLREAREARPRPIRDEKVIAGWNGLMIRALAEGAVVLGEGAHADRAAAAAEALWERLWNGERLARLWAGGAAREAGLLEDYVWMGLGFLALHEATGEDLWAERAATLARAAVARFEDADGRLRMAEADGPTGPVYESSDGAVPSGESSALELLARAGDVAGDPELVAAARRLRSAIAGQLTEIPLLRTEALAGSRILDALAEGGRSTLRRTVAGGRVRVMLGAGDPASGGGGWTLELAIAEGWHVNAHDPGTEGLVGAALDGAAGGWPEGTPATLGFADRPVRVYEGRIRIPVTPLERQIALTLQPCSDRLCLDPVTLHFRLPSA